MASATLPETTTTTEPPCIDRLPVEDTLRRLPLVFVTEGSDVSGLVDRVGGIGLVGPHSAGSAGSIRAQLHAAPTSPLLASDEEGGRVQRLWSSLGPLPSAARVASLSDADAVAAYTTYAQGMAGLGIDLNFAPVLAVGGGALGDRSYGDEPAVVTDRAGLFVDAMQGAGVLPVLKHFPGLGSVDVNTDEGVAVTPPLDQLRQRDLVPYAELLGREPVGVMVSHVRIPDLTGDTPASLAPATYELLVDEFGFDGLVVTDSLGAGAVASNWSTADAAVLAVQAGADMVVFTDPAQLDPVLDALRTAVADGRIPETHGSRRRRRRAGSPGRRPVQVARPLSLGQVRPVSRAAYSVTSSSSATSRPVGSSPGPAYHHEWRSRPGSGRVPRRSPSVRQHDPCRARHTVLSLGHLSGAGTRAGTHPVPLLSDNVADQSDVSPRYESWSSRGQ